MPDRRFVYGVEIDAGQAKAAAKAMRDLFARELAEIAASPGGGRGAANPMAAATAAAVKPAQQLEQTLRRVGEVDLTGSVDDLRQRMADLQTSIRQTRGAYEQMSHTADSFLNKQTSRRERAIFATNVDEVRKYAGDEAAEALRRLGRDINIGERGRELKNDQASDYTETEWKYAGKYDDVKRKQRFSAEETARLLEYESAMYDQELQYVRLDQELTQRRRAEIEGAITALSADAGDGERDELFRQMQEAYDASDRLAKEEADLLKSVAAANDRLAMHLEEQTRQSARAAGADGGGADGVASAAGATGQTEITISTRSVQKVERMAEALVRAADSSERMNAALTDADRRNAEIDLHREKTWITEGARVSTANELALIREAEEAKRAEAKRTAEEQAATRRRAEREQAAALRQETADRAQQRRVQTAQELAAVRTQTAQELAAVRQAEAQQRAEAKRTAQERAQADKQAAASARQSARERAQADREAAAAAKQSAKEEAAAQKQADKEAAASARQSAKERTAADKAAAREAAAAQRAAAVQGAGGRSRFSVGGALDRLDYLASAAAGGLAMFGVGQIAINAYDAGKTGAQQMRTAETYEIMANRVGVSSTRMLQAVQRASQGTVSETEAMQLSNQVMAQRFAASSTDLVADTEAMVAAARRFSQIYPDAEGRIMSTQEVYSRLITFVREGNKELVDQFGISNRRIAEVLDIPIEGLAGSEAASLRWQGTLKILQEEMARIGPAAVTMADQIEMSERRSTDAWNRMRQAMAPATAATAEGAAFLADRFAVATGTAGLPQVRGLVGTGANYQGPDVDNYLRAADQYDKALAANEESARGYEQALVRLGTALGNQGRLTGEQASELANIQRRLELIAAGQDAYGRAMSITTEEATKQNTEIYALVVAMTNYEEALIAGQVTMPEYIKALNLLAERLAVVATAAGLAAGGIAAVTAGAKGGANVTLPRLVVEETLGRGRTRDIAGAAGDGYRGGRLTLNPLTGETVPGKGDRTKADDPYDQINQQIQEDNRRAAEAAQREWESAAEKTAREFEAAAEAAAKAFEDSLGKVPGLFGTSGVTQEDMDAAKAGTYREKADERLRQLADEIINGVQTPEDAADWARRMGMDPGTDPKRVLAEAQRQWADSSLFAGGKNLDLIRWDVVQGERNQQAAAASGQQAILDYAKNMGLGNMRQIFGGNGQGMTLTIPGLTVGAPQRDTGGGAAAEGVSPPEKSGGATASPTAQALLDELIGSLDADLISGEVIETLNGIGEGILGAIKAGYDRAAAQGDWSTPVVASLAQQVAPMVLEMIEDQI